MIVRTASEYFNKHCGPVSQFSESQQSIIELKEDPPDAVEVMYLTSTNSYYERRFERKAKDPCFHLDVCVTTNKYLLPTLQTKAVLTFCRITANLSDADAILDLIRKHAKHEDQNGEVDKAVTILKNQHLTQLMSKQEFHAMLADDSNLLQLVIDKLALSDGLIKDELINCKTCKVTYSCPGFRDAWCPSCKKPLRNDHKLVGINAVAASYWIKKA